jgi:ubiquitin-conjugating enzyme (huntingtin interacting protein 2)
MSAEAVLQSRIRKELEELSKDKTSGITVRPTSQDSIMGYTGTLQGPADTVYAGGQWQIEIKLPKNYPFEPPKMRFMTPLWHPNVSSQTGAICLDILKDGASGAWSPALTMRTALMSLQALMCAPEPKDPQDAQVATQYLNDRRGWEAKAREWTALHAKPGGAGGTGGGAGAAAGGSSKPASAAPPAAAPAGGVPAGTPAAYVAGVKTIMEMGFDGPKALAAMNATRGNVQAALEKLMG